MPIQQKDFILRLMEQLASELRELRAALLDQGAAEAPRVVDQAVAAQAQLLGDVEPVLRSVDPATAASLIADTRRLRLWAELMRVEADGRELTGERDASEVLRRRSTALLEIADQRGDRAK